MQRNVVTIVWVVGLALTVLVYAIGPDRILFGVVDAVEQVRFALRSVLRALALDTFDLMRALTLGLAPVFVTLSVLAHRRGTASLRPVLLVAILLLVLLYQPVIQGEYVSTLRWTIAFAAVAVGSLVMTRRLTEPVPARVGGAWSKPGDRPFDRAWPPRV